MFTGTYEHVRVGREIGTSSRNALDFGITPGRDRPAPGDRVQEALRVPSCAEYSPRHTGTIGVSRRGAVFPKSPRYATPVPIMHG